MGPRTGPERCGAGVPGRVIEAYRMGRYIDQILQPGEKVLFSTNAHWIFFWPAIAGWILAAVMLGLSGMVPAGPSAMLWLSLGALSATFAPYQTLTALVHRLNNGNHGTSLPVAH